MNKILITGGAGFIGSNLIEKLIKGNNQITVVDNLSTGKRQNIERFGSKVKFFKHDVCNYRFMHSILDNDYDYIYCLAAVSSVADSIKRPYETHLINQESIINMLEYLRINHLKPKKILFTSSAAVYGNYPELPKSENSRVQPMTPYAIDKYATERYALSYSKLYGLPTVAVRLFNVFGPYQNSNSIYSGVLSIVSNCLIDQKSFTIFGDGNQTRDYVFVRDAVDAMIFIAEDSRSSEVYNVGYGISTSLNEIINKLEIISGRLLKISFQNARIGDITDSLADINRLTNLGFKPSWGLDKGLKKYWEFLQKEKNATS